MDPSAAFANYETQTACSKFQHHEQNAIQTYLYDSEEQSRQTRLAQDRAQLYTI